MNIIKICKKCNLEKSIEQFSKHSAMKEGRLNICISCTQNKRRKSFGKINPENTGQLKCPICNRVLHISRFRVYTKSKTGRYWMCEECKSYHSTLVKGDRNYFRKLRRSLVPEYRNGLSELQLKSRLKTFRNCMYRAARIRASKKGIEFNIQPEDIVIPSVCPLLNVPFVQGSKNDYSYTPSLDRIDNSKGHIKGNIWVISQRANSMKNDANWKEIHEFATNIIRYSPNYIKNENIESKDKEP